MQAKVLAKDEGRRITAKIARYAPAPKAPVRRSQALISRILSFLLRAPHARAWGQAMKGLLYMIPADPKAIRERCEITAPPTVEELRKIWYRIASPKWHRSQTRRRPSFMAGYLK